MIKGQQSVSDYVNSLQLRARYTFTRTDAQAALGLGSDALNKALQRLAGARRLRHVRRGFYVVVPLEYALAGSPPIDWFIDDLMKFMGHPYYVGALTAAAFHGAAHQQPQEFQVVVPVSQRTIQTNEVRIRFLRYEGVGCVQTESRNTHTGTIPISTPECTALDLVRFNKELGGLDSIMTIMTELGQEIQARALVSAAKREKVISNVQRLGWILDHAGWKDRTGPLCRWISKRGPARVALNAWLHRRQGKTDPKWRVIVNDQPESEI